MLHQNVFQLPRTRQTEHRLSRGPFARFRQCRGGLDDERFKGWLPLDATHWTFKTNCWMQEDCLASRLIRSNMKIR